MGVTVIHPLGYTNPLRQPVHHGQCIMSEMQEVRTGLVCTLSAVDK